MGETSEARSWGGWPKASRVGSAASALAKTSPLPEAPHPSHPSLRSRCATLPTSGGGIRKRERCSRTPRLFIPPLYGEGGWPKASRVGSAAKRRVGSAAFAHLLSSSPDITPPSLPTRPDSHQHAGADDHNTGDLQRGRDFAERGNADQHGNRRHDGGKQHRAADAENGDRAAERHDRDHR